nr:MAG TPA: ChiA1-BD-binding domain protein [Caudoviricetes sp.]
MKYVGTYSDPKDIVTKEKLETKQDKITGAATTIAENDLTASRALVSSSSGKVAVSAVTSTELGYLDGVTSNVQTQLDGKQGNNDEIQGLRLTGGLNSIGSMTQSVAINPAINGAGFAYKAGAIVKIYYDSYEMPIGDYDINSLFDGRFGTYINFPRPNGNFAWENSKTYPVGAYVTNDGHWYRALKENLNVTPTGDTTGAWELASRSGQSNYINLDNVLISIDITFPFAIRYDNSLSLYWRANYQNASYVKVEKYDSNLEWFQVYEKSSIDGGNIINNIWLSNDPSGAGTQKRMRITLKTQTGTTWCALTQIAITGIVGGIEGTLVNRGGSTMYGDLLPYVNGGASLGTSSAPWNNVRAHKFYGDGSNLTNIHYPVTSINTKTGAVQLNANDVGALPNTTVIPTKTSQLDNDSGFITTAPVTSVNSKTGAVVLTANDIGALPADTVIPTVNNATLTIKRNNIDVGSFTANSANDVNIDIDVPTDKSDIGLSNVDNIKQYSVSNPPPYPVTSVNGHTGAVTISSLPAVTTADNGKFLRVVNGAWAAVAIANANGGSF